MRARTPPRGSAKQFPEIRRLKFGRGLVGRSPVLLDTLFASYTSAIMTSALNQQSDNSVMGETADSKVPADGTGQSLNDKKWIPF